MTFHDSNRDQQPVRTALSDLEFLTVQELAEILKCSDRHITHLRAIGAVPKPVKLGALVRWHRKQIEDWVRDGCPKAESGDETVAVRTPVVGEKKVKMLPASKPARRATAAKKRPRQAQSDKSARPQPTTSTATIKKRTEHRKKKPVDASSSSSQSKGIRKDWTELYTELGLNPADFPPLSTQEILLVAWSAENALRNWSCRVPMTAEGHASLKKRLEGFAALVKREPDSYRRIFTPEFQGLSPAEYERMFPACEL